MRDDRDNLASMLKANGLRVTAPRRAVLGWLSRHPHATADDIQHGVYTTLGSISKQAVYDVLAAFTAASIVRRIEPAGHPARFEWARGDNHHHLVCRDCGCIVDAACDTEHSPCLTPVDDHGFVIEEAEVVYWGLCADCQHASQATMDDASSDATMGHRRS